MIQLTRKTRAQFYEALPKNGVGLEIGVQFGENAETLLRVTGATKLYLVDPWEPSGLPNWSAHDTPEEHSKGLAQTKERLGPDIESGRVVLCRGFSKDQLPLLPDHCCDWAYIDGDHRKDACLYDLTECNRIVKPGGIIMGHDYLSPKTSKFARISEFGVIDAVQHFCAGLDWQLVEIASSPEYQIAPSFMLKRRA
jgi:hypothetical protein